MIQRILTISILLIANLAFGQKLIPKDTLIADFNYLVKAIESTHPDPYSNFGNKIQYHRNAQLIKENIPQTGLSQFDFCNLILKFISPLNDGHTMINPTENGITDTLNFRLPIKLKIALDCIFISSTTENYKNLIGSKILSVENIKMDSLIKNTAYLLYSFFKKEVYICE